PAEALRHALTAPAWVETGHLTPQLAARLRTAADGAGLVLKSFLDLFRHPAPGVELLTLVKDYAKECRSRPDGPIPPEVATVLYYSAIAAALSRHGVLITTQDPAAVRGGLEWVAAQ